MKINDRQPIQPADIGKTAGVTGTKARTDGSPATDASGAGGASAPAAKIELSSRSRELHEALRAANAAPDVREDVVAQVRAKLTDGTYRVDPEQIARQILDTKA